MQAYSILYLRNISRLHWGGHLFVFAWISPPPQEPEIPAFAAFSLHRREGGGEDKGYRGRRGGERTKVTGGRRGEDKGERGEEGRGESRGERGEVRRGSRGRAGRQNLKDAVVELSLQCERNVD